MKRFLLILTTVILMGCNSENTSIAIFEDRGTLDYTLMSHIPILILKYPIRMIVLDDQFIIADFQRDTLFNYINEKGEFSKFGVQGRGTGEFIDGYGLAQLSDSSFIIGDRGNKKLTFFRLVSGNIIKDKEVKTPWVNNIFPYDEDIIVTNGQEPFEKNYGVLDLRTGQSYSYIDFPIPETEEERRDPLIQRMNYNHIVRKPDSNRFVSFRASKLLIDVMDLNDKELVLVRRTKYEQYQWEENEGNSNSPNTASLNSLSGGRITGSSSNIFICYKSKSPDDKSWNLLTFNWDGEPESRYKLPFVPYCTSATPDGKLYCIATIEMEYRIVQLKLE